MAIVLIEGFDHITFAEVPSKGWVQSNTGSQQMTSGRFGGQAYEATDGPRTITKVLPSTYSTLICGFAFQTNNVSTGQNWLAFVAGGTTVVRLQINVTGKLIVLNSGGTTIATGTTTLLANTWYYIEMKAVINGASGTVEVHLNGASGEIASTTGNFGSTNIDSLQLGFQGNSHITIVDDVYCADTTGAAPRNTFLGDVRVATIYPTGDGAHTAWTPNSGSTHYTQVDEAQADGDTSYVSDSAPGDLDTYTFDDIDTGATVYGVQTNLYARKDDANVRQIAPVIRQSTVDNVGTTVSLTSSYVFYTQIYNQDPTPSDWTPTTVNADEFGIKEIA